MTDLEQRILAYLEHHSGPAMDMDIACHVGEDLDKVRDTMQGLAWQRLVTVRKTTAPGCCFSPGGQSFLTASLVQKGPGPGKTTRRRQKA